MSRDITHSTRSVPLDTTASEVYPINWIQRIEISGVCPPSHQQDECGTRPFLRWVRAQGRSPEAPGIPKNASGPVGILSKGAPQMPSDKPNPSEAGYSLGDGPMRLDACSVTRHTRPDPWSWPHGRAKCVPSTGFSWLKSAVEVFNHRLIAMSQSI